MLPKMFYKYKTFSQRTLEMLQAEKVFFASPTSFNDPMDTMPHLDIDTSPDELRRIFKHLYTENILRSAATSVPYSRIRTQDTEAQMISMAKSDAQLLLSVFSLDETSSGEMQNHKEDRFAEFIEQLLRKQKNTGIVCLSERFDCSLMWSHYADQHRGICIAYGAVNDHVSCPRKVLYTEDRSVKASLVARAVDGNDDALSRLSDAVILRKAPEWEYEKEWRLMGPEGLHDIPRGLEMKHVIFGIRCPHIVQSTVINLLGEQQKLRPIGLFRMVEVRGTFRLRERSLYADIGGDRERAKRNLVPIELPKSVS